MVHVFVKHSSYWSLTLLFVLHFKSLTHQIGSKRYYVINNWIISKRHWAINTQNTKQLIESGPIWETFDKDRDHFELLIESWTKLRIWYKDRDQLDGLLQKKIMDKNTSNFENNKPTKWLIKSIRHQGSIISHSLNMDNQSSG